MLENEKYSVYPVPSDDRIMVLSWVSWKKSESSIHCCSPFNASIQGLMWDLDLITKSLLNTWMGSQSQEIVTSLTRFDLITLTFHENSNHGRWNYWESGVQIPTPEGQNFFVLFHFQIFHTKLGIFDFNYFLIPCFVI